MVGRGKPGSRGLLSVQERCGQPERLGPDAAASGDRHGVLDDPHKMALRRLPQGPAPGTCLAMTEAVGRRRHDGQERPIGKDLDRREHQVLLDPPGHVGAGRDHQAPQFVAGEVAVGQQQHPGAERMQQQARELMLAGPGDPVEGGVEDGVRAALGQRQQPDLRVAALGHAELTGILRGISRVYPRPVPGHQPQAERERPGRPLAGQRSPPQVEQQLQRLGAEPLPRLGQRRTGRQRQAVQVPQPVREPPHHRPVARRSAAVRSTEQAQTEHEIHHQPRGQQPLPLLTAARQLDHLIDECRGDLPGQDPQVNLALRAAGSRKRRRGHDRLSEQRSSSKDEMRSWSTAVLPRTSLRQPANAQTVIKSPQSALDGTPAARRPNTSTWANALIHRHCFELGGLGLLKVLSVLS